MSTPQLAGLGLHGGQVARGAGAVLEPVEGVHDAAHRAEGIVVDLTGEEHAAVVDHPLDVVGSGLHEVLVQQTVHAPLGFAQLLLHDDGRVALDALLLLHEAVHAKGALDAHAVASEDLLALQSDDAGAFLGSLYRGGQARDAAAHNDHAAVDDFGDGALVDGDAGGAHILGVGRSGGLVGDGAANGGHGDAGGGGNGSTGESGTCDEASTGHVDLHGLLLFLLQPYAYAYAPEAPAPGAADEAHCSPALCGGATRQVGDLDAASSSPKSDYSR